MYKKILQGLVLTAISAGAAETIGKYNLDVYEDYARVYENKTVNKAGKNLSIKEYKIPSSIVENSIYVKSNNIKINEISYNKNKINFENLLKDRLMKKIRFFNMEEDGTQKTIIEGTLMSVNPIIINDFEDKLYTFVDRKDIIIDEIPTNYHAKNNIEIKYDAKTKGEKYSIGYMVKGLSCSPVYNITIDKNSADIKGYMLIDNKTDKTYNNANVRCVAGKFEAPKGSEIYPPMMSMAKTRGSHQGIRTRGYASINNDAYEVYKLTHKTNVEQNSKKLNPFIDKNKIKISENNKLIMTQTPYSREGVERRFKRYLVIENTKNNKLGIDFHKGEARVYKKNKGLEVYHGGSDIKFTQKGKEVEILLGENNKLIVNEEIKLASTKKRTESHKYENVTYNESLFGKEFKITNIRGKEENFAIVLKADNRSEMEVISITCDTDVGKCEKREGANKIEIKGQVKKEANIKIKYKLITGKNTVIRR